ncbi:g_PROTEIN_RECEP_F1_2 domain-containing protein [Caerostris darwini]|uniref:G_PROTEIN_RECEP_F1_2 domain-containing protein n=1 Tax=Caerostris darwini TaxID=1538125 RepID=A0AAV4WSX9_9ARAC|nr:g_PROTEIN_RECEP_F1_2 domain-containing protein [Caerostris darwini]
MPLELYSLWHQYPWHLGTLTCSLRSVMSEATAYASILTIMKFSCDQYYAVCHPLHNKTKAKVKIAFRNIIIIWLISLTLAAPYGFFTKVNYITVSIQINSLLKYKTYFLLLAKYLNAC